MERQLIPTSIPSSPYILEREFYQHASDRGEISLVIHPFHLLTDLPTFPKKSNRKTQLLSLNIYAILRREKLTWIKKLSILESNSKKIFNVRCINLPIPNTLAIMNKEQKLARTKKDGMTISKWLKLYS